MVLAIPLSYLLPDALSFLPRALCLPPCDYVSHLFHCSPLVGVPRSVSPLFTLTSDRLSCVRMFHTHITCMSLHPHVSSFLSCCYPYRTLCVLIYTLPFMVCLSPPRLGRPPLSVPLYLRSNFVVAYGFLFFPVSPVNCYPPTAVWPQYLFLGA